MHDSPLPIAHCPVPSPESPVPTPVSLLQSLSDDLAAAVARAARSVVAIGARRRIPSSGILWKPGVVVAAHHTVHRDDDIPVVLANGTETTASVAGRDPGTDLVVLRLAGELPRSDSPDSPIPAAIAAEPDAIRVGSLVLALGRPGREVTASLGVVSAIAGEWRTWTGGRIDRLVRLDLSIYDGFSGGPLVDASGRVLGLDTSALARGAALAIPASTVERVAEQLLSQGRVRRGYVGIGMQPVRLPENIAAKLAPRADVGLMVVSVEPDGPADRAGILIGDIVVAFDGVPVTDTSELLAHLGGDRVGAAVPVRLVRAGAETTVNVTIGERASSGTEGRETHRRGHRRGR